MAETNLTFASTFFFSLAPVLVWFWFILKEDPHPEPRTLTLAACLLGGLGVAVSYYGEFGLERLGLTSELYPHAYYFLSAIIEELAKFIPIALLILPSRFVDEPVDAMIYLGFSAIGFAFTENFLGLVTLQDRLIGTAAAIALLRSIGANFLHLLASVLIGFGYADAKLTRRLFPLVLSFLLAISLHFLYNTLITNEDVAFFIFPILWAVFFTTTLKEFRFLKRNDGRLQLRGESW